jgi:ATP-binding cassette subfamily F protein uup
MLEEALADFDGAVLVVSHDRYFLDRICDQVIAFEPRGMFVQPGNYSYYLEKRKEREARNKTAWPGATKAAASQSEPAADAKPARPRKFSFKEQRELEGMEAAILSAENRVSSLEKTLNDPEFHATRSRESPGLIKELEAARAEVARLYDRWHVLEEKK